MKEFAIPEFGDWLREVMGTMLVLARVGQHVFTVIMLAGMARPATAALAAAE